MSKKIYSAEEAAEVMARARAILAGDELFKDFEIDAVEGDGATDAGVLIAEQEGDEWQLAPRESAKRVRRIDTPMVPLADVRQIVADAVANGRRVMLEIVGGALGEAFDGERRQHRRDLAGETRSLRLESPTSKFRLVMSAGSDSKALDWNAARSSAKPN
jgi:hypothetical protein